MNITNHLILSLALLLLPNGSCSEVSGVSLAPPPIEPPLAKIRQDLVDLGIDPEAVAQADDVKLASLERLFSHIPTWASHQNLDDFRCVKCEACWFMGVIGTEEAANCITKNSAAPAELDEKFLVNAFADRHAFELGKIAVGGGSRHLEDETELGRLAKELIELAGSADITRAPYRFLQHSLKLMKKNSVSQEHQRMFEAMMTLHLSSYAAANFITGALELLYHEMKIDTPTLFYVKLPSHAAAAVAIHRPEDTYDVVFINSGYGNENHQAMVIQEKGFHAYQRLGAATAYVPTMEFKGVTKEQLKKAGYHSGSMEQVYYKNQPEVKVVEKRHIMPWELSDSQSIGTCTVTSIWYTLHYYYQALVFESDVRLSFFEQVISEIAGLQPEIQKVEDEIDTDYIKRRNASREAAQLPLEMQGTRRTVAEHNKRLRTHKEVPYYSKTAKALWDKKEKLQNGLRMRRELVVVGLNGVLQNVITLFHEFKDIRAKTIFWNNIKSQSMQQGVWVSKEKQKKAIARAKLLEEAIPRIMTSFHAFWAEQKQRCISNPDESEVAKQDRILKCMTWGAIEDDTRTLYSDAVKLIEGKDIGLVKGQLGRQSVKKGEPLVVHSLPIHKSLRLILDRTITDGDSEALRTGIDVHLESYRGSKDANYLLVLYAALNKSASLLDYLVNVKGLPLRYHFHALVPKNRIMLLSDVTSEGEIPIFAALEFSKYGQPLDSFPQLFTLRLEPAKRVVSKFVQEYRKRIPTTDYDAAIAEFAERGKLALLAYTAPKASEQVKADLFMKSEDVGVLSILLTGITHEQLKAKLSEATAKGNTAIVELLFPSWLSEERRVEASKKAPTGDFVIKDTHVPRKWIETASEGRFMEVLQQLLPYGASPTIEDCLTDIASKGYTDVTLLLAEYSSSSRVDYAVAEAADNGHLELAATLARLYPSKEAAEKVFRASAVHGNPALTREFIHFVGINDIDHATTTATNGNKFEVVEVLVEYASPHVVEQVSEQMIGKESASSAFAKALQYISSSFIGLTLIGKASEAGDHNALQALLPFMGLEEAKGVFLRACIDNKFATVSFFSSFAQAGATDFCFKKLVDRETTPAALLEGLLPRMSRSAVFELRVSLGTKEHLKESTRTAINKRVEGFAADLVFLHAFLVEITDDPEGLSSTIQSLAKRYSVELPPLCTNSEDCVRTIEQSRTLVSAAVVEEAIQHIGRSPKEIAKAVPHLLSFASPFVCTYLIESSPGVSVLVPAFADVCAKKALKPAVVRECVHAVSEGDFKTMRQLTPHISPHGVLTVLQSISYYEYSFLEMLNQSQLDGVLNLTIREQTKHFEEKDARLTSSLRWRASNSARDVSLLYVTRCELSRRKYFEEISKSATEEGRKAAEQLVKRIS